MGAWGGSDNEEPDNLAPDAHRENTDADEIRPDPPPSPSEQESRTPAEAKADLRQQADGNWAKTRRFDPPRAELARFDFERAGLRPISVEEADKYTDQHREDRPWLAMTDQACPEARRIIAALDAAGGHAHIRHEGWVTEEANRRRVAFQEDPAQLDPEKRALGIDGTKQDDRPHLCRSAATRITNPDTFATAFTRAINHPEFRRAFETEYDPDVRPDVVAIPIDELLGPDGSRYCTGWRLDPGDGSMNAARTRRDAWIAARAEGREAHVPEPQAAPVRSFAGGDIVFAFARNDVEKRYEIATSYPRPAQ